MPTRARTLATVAVALAAVGCTHRPHPAAVAVQAGRLPVALLTAGPAGQPDAGEPALAPATAPGQPSGGDPVALAERRILDALARQELTVLDYGAHVVTRTPDAVTVTVAVTATPADEPGVASTGLYRVRMVRAGDAGWQPTPDAGGGGRP